jgi:hypothetical protein
MNAEFAAEFYQLDTLGDAKGAGVYIVLIAWFQMLPRATQRECYV